MLKEYFEAFEHDREFKGRTGRKFFWRASIPDLIIWALDIIFYFVFPDVNIIFVAIAAVYMLATFSSRLSLWIRRMHDTGISGTFCFAIFVPVLGVLALLFIFLSDSQPKDNEFGPYVNDGSNKKKRKKKK